MMEILEITTYLAECPDNPADAQAAGPIANPDSASPYYRFFRFAFASHGPDSQYDREAVPVSMFRDTLGELDAAVLDQMTGRDPRGHRLCRAGAALARLLLPEWIIERLFAMREGAPLVIRADEEAAVVPWELCFSDRHGQFMCQWLAVSRGLAVSHTVGLSNRTEPTGGPIGLPYVSTICNPDNDPALREASHRLDAISMEIEAVSQCDLHMQANGVTLSGLQNALTFPCFRYFGHIRASGGVTAIPCLSGTELAAVQVGRELSRGVPPKFVLLNGCGGDHSAPSAALDAARMQESPDAACRTSMVREMYRRGVTAVIGCRYEVDAPTAFAADEFIMRAFAAPGNVPIGELLRLYRRREDPGWPSYVLYGDPLTVFRLVAPDADSPRFAVAGKSQQSPGLRHSVFGYASATRTNHRQPSPRTPLWMGVIIDPSPSACDQGSQGKIVQRIRDGLHAEAALVDARRTHIKGNGENSVLVREFDSRSPENDYASALRLPFRRGKGVQPSNLIRLAESLRQAAEELRSFIARYGAAAVPPPHIILVLTEAVARPDAIAREPKAAANVRAFCDLLREISVPPVVLPGLAALSQQRQIPAAPAEVTVLAVGGELDSEWLQSLAGRHGGRFLIVPERDGDVSSLIHRVVAESLGADG